jgi:hypothetical protein
MMNKNLIKLFTFCLFKEQAASRTKTSAKQTFKCEEYLQCDKKKILTLQYWLFPQTCIQLMEVALEKLRDTEYLCWKTNTYQ